MLSLQYSVPCWHSLIHSPIIWCLGYIIKQIFHAIFCLILELFIFSKVIFNFASRLGIFLTSGEQFLILNKKAWNIFLNTYRFCFFYFLQSFDCQLPHFMMGGVAYLLPTPSFPSAARLITFAMYVAISELV